MPSRAFSRWASSLDAHSSVRFPGLQSCAMAMARSGRSGRSALPLTAAILAGGVVAGCVASKHFQHLLLMHTRQRQSCSSAARCESPQDSTSSTSTPTSTTSSIFPFASSAKERLIIFCKYPRPGFSKTRLAPALGPGGAALAHKEMAEDTFRLGRAFQLDRRKASSSSSDGVPDVEIFLVGESKIKFRRWLKRALIDPSVSAAAAAGAGAGGGAGGGDAGGKKDKHEVAAKWEDRLEAAQDFYDERRNIFSGFTLPAVPIKDALMPLVHKALGTDKDTDTDKDKDKEGKEATEKKPLSPAQKQRKEEQQLAFRLEPQPDGDLGQKLRQAFVRAFGEGRQRVVSVGTDCPDLSVDLLREAFDHLKKDKTVVVGPATDGGYYLIGLSERCDALFQDIDWSTSKVLSQALQRAKDAGFKVHKLPTLSDIDTPSDLPVLEKARARAGRVPSRAIRERTCSIGVVIPTLNEAATIATTIHTLLYRASSPTAHNIQVVVSDAGSTDGTYEKVKQLVRDHPKRVRYVWGRRSRAEQFNRGVDAFDTPPDILFFLHGDTTMAHVRQERHTRLSLPLSPCVGPPSLCVCVQGWDRDLVDALLSDPFNVAGAFRFKVDSPRWLLRAIEWSVLKRCEWFQFPYGDQGLFMAHSTFQRLGGFRTDHPIMEDFEIVQRLRKMGRIALTKEDATTSARRWDLHGVPKVTFLNWFFALAYLWGVSPKTIYKWSA